jgi:hypothetical protein
VYNYKPSPFLSDYCLYSDDLALIAFHMLFVMRKHKIVAVIYRETDKVCGVITDKDFESYNRYYFGCTSEDLACKKAQDVMTKDFIGFMDTDDYYSKANDVYTKRGINDFIITDKDGYLKDIISTWQFRFREFYEAKNVPWMHYAIVLYNAARIAKEKGFRQFSALEFGVCRGGTLTYAELIPIEIEKLFDIQINLYGFDLGDGLPIDANDGPIKGLFKKGDYKSGGVDEVGKRLRKAKLIIGDIAKTAKSFLTQSEYDIENAPIGAMFIDVDIYESTLPCLDILNENEKYFLPIIPMFFDDIFCQTDTSGEQKAIREFNRDHKDIKILPEIYYDYEPLWKNMSFSNPGRELKSIKYCFRSADTKFADLNTEEKQLMYKI